MICIGTDIVSIKRIENIINNKGQKFLDHIFTKKEQQICNNKSIPSIHYSGKFAAKEAIKKALLSSNVNWSGTFLSIEINNNEFGAPIVNVDNQFRFSSIQVSISHEDEYAIATAIIEVK